MASIKAPVKISYFLKWLVFDQRRPPFRAWGYYKFFSISPFPFLPSALVLLSTASRVKQCVPVNTTPQVALQSSETHHECQKVESAPIYVQKLSRDPSDTSTIKMQTIHVFLCLYKYIRALQSEIRCTFSEQQWCTWAGSYFQSTWNFCVWVNSLPVKKWVSIRDCMTAYHSHMMPYSTEIMKSWPLWILNTSGLH